MCQRTAAFRAPFSRVLCFVSLVAGCGGQSVSEGNLASPADGASTEAAADASGEGTLDASPQSNFDAGIDASLEDASTGADGGVRADAPVADAAGPDAMACSPGTCPTGCCDTNGNCKSGNQANECGSGGQACQPCAANGLICAPVQRCVVPTQPSCGPTNCAGCCMGAQCLLGTDGQACGGSGGQCVNCLAVGMTCIAQGESGGACGPAGPPPCDDASCPTGCCDANGKCQPGMSNVACGADGMSCQNCSTLMDIFHFDCLNQSCVAGLPCLCTTGCCDATGACQPGASNTQCGSAYTYCQDCTLLGDECSDQSCVAGLDAGVCNAQTCPSGCCDSFGVCQQGLTGTTCGTGGINCQNCLDTAQTCSNQQCVGSADGGACGPDTCQGCCDALGNCIEVNGDTQCGSGGRSCVNCAELGGTCWVPPPPPPNVPPGGMFESGPVCLLPDGAVPCPQSCDGCCDVRGNCQPGFTDAQCGESGATCLDCTSGVTPSTCDANVSPRTCARNQTQCPSPYPSCPSALTETAPARQKVCSALELQSAAAACAGGASTTACGAFFNFESGSNPSCDNCLQAFDYDFVTQVGTRACVAPYLDAACNHNSACLADCVTESCYDCVDSASTMACDTQVQTATCAAYFQADQCVTQALAGAGAVCNPATYQGNFGAWLQAVGAQYCGP